MNMEKYLIYQAVWLAINVDLKILVGSYKLHTHIILYLILKLSFILYDVYVHCTWHMDHTLIYAICARMLTLLWENVWGIKGHNGGW